MADYDNYKNLGGNIAKVGNVITKLENIKNSWDEAVDSTEKFYGQFNTKMDTLIKNLKTYKAYLENKGKTIQKYAEWCD